jgi:hypothetical protein
MEKQLEPSVVVKAIIARLKQNLAVQIQAAKDAHLAATHSESIAETKYDTFGLESSYLAQGQQKRVAEVTQALHYFQQLNVTDGPMIELITCPCFISLVSEYEEQRFFMLAQLGGGLKVTVGDIDISVITPGSPVGRFLLDKMTGDEVNLPIKGKPVVFEVVEIA